MCRPNSQWTVGDHLCLGVGDTDWGLLIAGAPLRRRSGHRVDRPTLLVAALGVCANLLADALLRPWRGTVMLPHRAATPTAYLGRAPTAALNPYRFTRPVDPDTLRSSSASAQRGRWWHIPVTGETRALLPLHHACSPAGEGVFDVGAGEVGWLRRNRLLLPGVSVLARQVAEVRSVAEQRLYAMVAKATRRADACSGPGGGPGPGGAGLREPCRPKPYPPDDVEGGAATLA